MEEEPIPFDSEEYPNGLNANFLKGEEESGNLVELYGNGKGRFENPEVRDIAAHQASILEYLCRLGLGKGSSIVDIGAGTGLFTRPLSEIVGPDGTVFATEISAAFGACLRGLGLPNVQVIVHEERVIGLKESCCDFVLLSDVYHHLTYPVTVMKELKLSLRPGGKLLVIDFHRDSAKIKSHPPGWVERHVRGDQATFRSEILSAGFALLEEPDLGMHENYAMTFIKQ